MFQAMITASWWRNGVEWLYNENAPVDLHGSLLAIKKVYHFGNLNLVLFPNIEPPVFDSNAVSKPSLSLQEVLLCQGFSYPPLVELGVYVKPKGIQETALTLRISGQRGFLLSMLEIFTFIREYADPADK